MEFFQWKTISPKKNTFCFIRRIPLLGSVIKVEKINVKNIDLNEIDEIAKNNQAIFVKVEPFAEESKQKELDDLFLPHGYTHDTWPLSSTASYVIDLSQPYEKIVANFKSKFRYNLRLAKGKNELKVGIINGKELIENPTLLHQFTNIYNNRAKEIRSEQHSYEELLHMCESYGEKLRMIFCSTNIVVIPDLIGNLKKDQDSRFPSFANSYGLARRGNDNGERMIMASFFLQTDDILHYWHNGSTQEGRKLFAPTLVIAEGIKLGQKLECKIFDFEGIYDPRFHEQTKRWKGFTRFKEGFNGEKVIYARPYIKYYSPIFKFFHLLKMI